MGPSHNFADSIETTLNPIRSTKRRMWRQTMAARTKNVEHLFEKED